MSRPLFFGFISFASGIYVAFHSTWWLVIILLLVSVRYRKSYWILFVLLFLVGFFRALPVYSPSVLDEYLHEGVTIRGEVRSFPKETEYGVSFVFKVEEIEGRKVSEYVSVSVPRGKARDFLVKDLELEGYLSLPGTARNPGEFDYREYLRKNGIHYTYTAQSFVSYDERRLWQKKYEILQVFDKQFSGETASFLKAILLGFKGDLPSELRDSFSKSGTSHLIAISGLHVGIMRRLISNGLAYLMRASFARVFSVLILVPYGLLVGPEPSVWRAIVMVALAEVALYLRKEYDSINVLGLAGIVLLMVKPEFVFSVGFQLSFMATLAILLLMPEFSGIVFGYSRRGFWQESIAVSLAAQLGVLPILAYYFNQISLLTLLANLVLIPLTGLVIISGVIIFSWMLFLPGYLGISFLEWLVSLFLGLVEFFSGLPWAYVYVKSPDVYQLGLYYLILFLGFGHWRPRQKVSIRRYGVVLLLLFVLFIQGFESSDELTITVLSVGNAESIFISLPNGERMVIDGGFTGRELTGYLRTSGVNRLDYVFLSHGHWDHLGGLVPLTEDYHWQKASFYEGEPGSCSFSLGEYAKVSQVDTGDVLRFPGYDLSLEIISAPYYGASCNDSSLVMKLTYNQVSILFTGDLEEEGEKRLLGDPRLNSTILKVGHHGSQTSTSSSFLKSVSPKAAIVSVGSRGINEGVLFNLESHGVRVYSTEELGAITIRTDGVSYRIQGFLQDR